ncbi:hypothetical protein PR002_g29841 [Phytophthora rubi]|uniref:Uncharacterized protein n=1 Tax=Phytophthora rubi TaxID=129364 RepID=A0A6A3GX25_9STRA|nr:hypothetical protein PR002_g29841 [Phytophthora rubi]
MALPRRLIINILNEEIWRHNAALNEVDPNEGVVGILNTGKRQFAAIAQAWNMDEVDVRAEARRYGTSSRTPPMTPVKTKTSHLAARLSV